MFIIGKLFLIKIMIRYNAENLPDFIKYKPIKTDRDNLKIIGSIIYYQLLEFFKYDLKIMKIIERLKNDDDVMSKEAFPQKKLSAFIEDKIWTQYISGLFYVWLDKLLKVIETKFL